MEFALVGVMFFLLFIGVLEVGRFAYGANAMTNAAREGARFAVAGVNGTSGCSWASGNGLDRAARAQISGIPANQITVSASPDAASTYCEVTVSWAYQPLTGGFNGVFRSTTVSSTSREYFN